MGVCDSDWVPVLANHGFEFHHVHEGLVVMIKWLPEKETNQVFLEPLSWAASNELTGADSSLRSPHGRGR